MVIGILFLLIIFFSVEGIAKLWWFEIESCAFENSDVYDGVNPEMKRQMCVDSYQLQISDELIEPLQESETININSFGFRGKDVALEKPDNTYRIFAIGGSTMLGTGSTSDVTTIPGYLQENFDELELPFNVEVINAGISGAWSKTETSLIKTKLLNFQPDMIIVYDGWNDSSDQAGWTKNNDNAEEIVLKWILRWNEICDMGENNGYETIIILQPILGTSERILSEKEYAIYSEIQGDNTLKRLDLLGDGFESLSDTCTQKLDFRSAFDGINQPIFWDRGHLGNTGNQIIAKKIFQNVVYLITDIEIKTTGINHSLMKSDMESTVSKDFFVQSKRFILKNYKTPLLINHLFSFNKEQLVTQIGHSGNNVKTISDINFSQNLQNSDFRKFYLPNSNFSNTNLQNSDFSNSYIKNSDFEKSSLSHSKFINANMRGINLHNTKLDFVDFSHSDLTGGVLSNSDLSNAKFINSYLYNVNMRNSNLSNIDFSLTNILGVDFQGSNLNNVNLSGQDLRRSFLMDTDLTNANLEGSFLGTHNIENAILVGANLSSTTFTRNNFKSLDLTDVNFTDSELFNADFKNTDLSRTNFSNSNLKNADFANSNLEDAIGGPFLGCKNHFMCK